MLFLKEKDNDEMCLAKEKIIMCINKGSQMLIATASIISFKLFGSRTQSSIDSRSI